MWRGLIFSCHCREILNNCLTAGIGIFILHWALHLALSQSCVGMTITAPLYWTCVFRSSPTLQPLPLPYGTEGWPLRTSPQSPSSPVEQLGSADGRPEGRRRVGAWVQGHAAHPPPRVFVLSPPWSLATSVHQSHSSWQAALSRASAILSVVPFRPTAVELRCFIILY